MTGRELTDDPRPTRTSTMFVVLAGLATAAALVRAADVVWPAVVGAVGALTLAVVIWACGWERHETAGSVLASLLVLPVGFGMVATTAGTILVLASSLFPAPSLSDVPTLVIHLSARAMVVTGGVATVFGVAAATRGILDEDAVEDAATTALLTATAPFLVALVLAVGAVLRYLEANAHGPGVKTLLGDVVREFSALIFQPEPLGPHIPTFTVLVGIALLATNRGLRALPLTELVPANGDGEAERLRKRIETTQRGLYWAALAALALVPVAAVLHLLAPPARLRATLGPGLYGVVAAVTANPALRSLAWWLILTGSTIAGVVWLSRRFVQSSPDRIGSVVAPVAAGGAFVAAAFLVAGDVLSTAMAWVAEKLPGEFGEMFTTTAGSVVEVYGATTIVLAAVAALLFLTAVAMSLLGLTITTGFLDERTAGITIASLALFNTAAFAGVLDVSNALVLVALVAAVMVWDAGEFGVTLGQEIGRRANTRRGELVHATGTLAVGGFGAGIALFISGQSIGAIDAGTGPVALGLVTVLGGLLLLVVALR